MYIPMVMGALFSLRFDCCITDRHARSYLQYVVLEEESCSASAVCIWILAVGIRFSMSS